MSEVDDRLAVLERDAREKMELWLESYREWQRVLFEAFPYVASRVEVPCGLRKRQQEVKVKERVLKAELSEALVRLGRFELSEKRKASEV